MNDLEPKGIIAWFCRNSVAANLLMLMILAGGIYSAVLVIPLESFPRFEQDSVSIRVPYRGSTPSDVEKAVVLRVEEALEGLAGIREIEARAREGSANITVEVANSYDPRELKDEIKNRIDAINNFPRDVERPLVSINQPSSRAINVIISGELTEKELRLVGEQVRTDIEKLEEVSQVDLSGVRPFEITIEVDEGALREYGLTIDDISRAINRSSFDRAAGTIKAEGGDILLRTSGQGYFAKDFEEIVVIPGADGTLIKLKDIAKVKDDFDETPLKVIFNGKASVTVKVSRVGDENTIKIAEAVKAYVEDKNASGTLPPGVDLSYWQDDSERISKRLSTLWQSLAFGIALVIIILSLFLRLRLAFWVCVGIPVGFAGALLVLPIFDVTINLISAFAFILVLGIVVDDAIVTSEHVYTRMHDIKDPTLATIIATKQVAVPVTFGVMTTIAAFAPLFLFPGMRGKIFAQIPMVVISVLIFSLIESKLVLPSHLKHIRVNRKHTGRFEGFFIKIQRVFSGGLMKLVHHVYQPVLGLALRNRYVTFAIFIAVGLGTIGYVSSGRIGFQFFPAVERTDVGYRLTLADGTPSHVTEQHIRRINEVAVELQEKYQDPVLGGSIIKNIAAAVGTQGLTWGRGGDSGGSSHIGEVAFEIAGADEQSIGVGAGDLARELRQKVGDIPGAREVTLSFQIGRGGSPIDIQLEGESFEEMEKAAAEIKLALDEFDGVYNIFSSFELGKQQIDFNLKPRAEELGLTKEMLSEQVRAAFYGQEAQRIQRGRDEIRVMIRYPLRDRRDIHSLEKMKVLTPDRIEIPISEVAELKYGKSYTEIRRVDRNRTVNIRAEVDANVVEDIRILRDGVFTEVDEIVKGYQGIGWSFEGEAREESESNDVLFWGTMFVLFIIYAMLAIPFRSWTQPLVVMLIIPFGLLGAIFGHLIMGFGMSMMSYLGMLALTGVVVNDSLVLVDYVNQKRAQGGSIHDAVWTGGVARFRPILLTSLTTFFGLVPLIFEKSSQAQFLIPMAVSLGFGIMFATFITLILVPTSYLIIEDIGGAMRRIGNFRIGGGKGKGSPDEGVASAD